MEKQEDICVLCCRKTTIYAVGVCDHPVCYECSARMRVLCKQNECPICRQDMPKVVFTQKLELFNTLNQVAYPLDRKYKIFFKDDICQRMYDKLLEHSCKLCPSKPYFHTFGHLKHHMRRTHERFYCDLCVENLWIFTSERKCYTREGLARHRRIGDLDDTSHRGHPLCEFCDQRYIDQDELFRHLRREHFFCHFCDADGDINKFYSDYEYLRAHFRREHYLCEEGSCQDEKFTPAFRSEIDLKAHRAIQHSKNLSKAQAKQARTLELEFTIKPRNSQQNGYISLAGEHFRRQENQRHEKQFGSYSTINNRERNSIRSNSSTPNSRNGCLVNTSLNTRSEEEFPRLTPSVSPVHNITSTTNKTKANSITKGTLNTIKISQNKPILVNDDFPALGSNSKDCAELQASISSRPTLEPHSQKTVLFHFNSQNCRKNSTKLHINAEKKRDVNLFLGENNFNSSHSNSKMVLPGREDCLKFEIDNLSSKNITCTLPFPDETIIEKKVLEENFPQLCNVYQQNNAKSLIMPIVDNKNRLQSVVNSENYQPFIMMKCKSKKKKQKSIVGIEVSPKEMHPNKSNIKAREISALTLAQLVNTNIFENQETENMLPADKELNKYKNGNDGIVEEIEKQTENLIVENNSSFTNRKICTPPGFSSSSISLIIPPPGFIPSSSENFTVPPTDSLSAVAKQLTGNLQDIAVIQLTQTQSPNYVYVEPSDFQHRNVILIQQIQKLLDGNNTSFTEFKSLSGRFRQSCITAEDYYKECLKILGKDNFLQVIPELLVLLPDINKQQDLLSILKIFLRNESENSGAVPKGALWKDDFRFEICAICKQVLSKNDFEDHNNNAHLTKMELNS